VVIASFEVIRGTEDSFPSSIMWSKVGLTDTESKPRALPDWSSEAKQMGNGHPNNST